MLEQFWDQILSGEPEKVRAAFASLEPQAQEAVLEHLEQMAQGAGWQPVQQQSALTALRALEEFRK